MFIQATIDFTIVAVVLFLLVKGIKKTQALNKKKEEKQDEQVVTILTKDQELLEEIRDLLKKVK